jgi:o-succinylbenzoate synthase
MLRIERLRLREIRLPLKEPFQISSGTVGVRRICLLELLDEAGRTGWGESVADDLPNYSSETVDTVWLAVVRWLAPRILGVEMEGPEAVHERLASGIQGHRMARAMVEMACWALAAERAEVPLADLLGGTRTRVETGISIGMQPTPAALLDRARIAYAAGYRKIKVKIGPGADIEYVAAVREALGGGAPLMADANSAYALADAEHLARLDAYDLMMIEQPLAQDDLVRHAALQRTLRTPICLDESITGPERAEDMIALGSARIVNIKPGRVGGFTPAGRIHDVCAAAGVPVWCGGMLESGIGRAHNVALASLPNFSLPGDLSPSARYWARDVVEPEWTMSSDGLVAVPRGRPGLGVEVRAAEIDRLTVRTCELSRESIAAGSHRHHDALS